MHSAARLSGTERGTADEPVAIVGMAALYPDAEGVEEYWRLMSDASGRASSDTAGDSGPGDVRDGLDHVTVDVAAFRIPPAQAGAMTRLQLLMLEAAGRCLADAGGVDRAVDRDRTDVVVGTCFGLDRQYANALRIEGRRYARELQRAAEASEDPLTRENAAQAAEELRSLLRQRLGASPHDRVGEMASTIPARIATAFKLRGRTLALESADATSFLALSHAVTTLRGHASDAALVVTGQRRESELLPRALAAKGLTWPLGEGVGAVLLKRLSTAEQDGDRIYATVRACVVRHEARPGAFGYARSPDVHRAGLAEALAVADTAEESIGYVEYAGGEPVASAVLGPLAEELGRAAGRRPVLGDTAERLGHTLANAGLAAVSKAALALHHRTLPPTVGPMDRTVDGRVDDPVDRTAHRPTDRSMDRRVDDPVDRPVDGPVNGRADRPTDRRVDGPIDDPVDRPMDRRVDDPVDRPVDGPVNGRADRPTDRSVDGRVDRRVDRTADRPTDRPMDRRVDRTADRPTDRRVDRTVDSPIDDPVDRPLDRRVDDPVDRPVDGPVNGRADRPTDRSMDGRVDRRVDDPVDGRVDRHIDGRVDRRVDDAVDDPVNRRVDDPADRPVDRPIDGRVDGPIDDPVDRPLDNPKEGTTGPGTGRAVGELPFRRLDRAGDWPAAAPDVPRRALVVGTSLTGSVCHLVLEEHLPRRHRAPAAPREPEPIAVLALGGRFAGAADAEAFWRTVLSGRDRFAPLPHSALDPELYHMPGSLGLDRSYTDRGAAVTVPEAPPGAVNVSPERYASLDPAGRLALGVAAELFAGRSPADAGLRGRPGLVALGSNLGLSRDRRANTELWLPRLDAAAADLTSLKHLSPAELDELLAPVRRSYPAPGAAVTPGLLDACLASGSAALIASAFGLDAVPLAVEAACASSLAALDVAIGALRSGAVDYAVAGGVELPCNERDMVLCSALGLLSHDRITPFDEAADGFTPGDGCALFLLKRLSDARRDGDVPLALLRGVGASNDAKSLIAPDVDGQVRAMRQAFEQVDFTPADVDYLEAHGTGTKVGDRVEVSACREVYGGPRRTRPLDIGSAKSFFGHTFAAAGSAGLLRALLAMRAGILPPNANLETVNPALGLSSIPATISADAGVWPRVDGRPRRAGVSSFGTGGINYHLLVEEDTAPHPTHTPDTDGRR